ncbi:alpha/beta-hydrolase [Westerdykella ornata]|uniref:Alpha/beta-hydrolase n=1 Tax=Westerdykella ornata TaxID=318751 RepID=A0A6A6JGN6_WESOR|nr:alpha/beta-hydrolase [Westerdykella ornata]KAF2275810.1 alpha/beta-hydrolase [Westerdykella ornata]
MADQRPPMTPDELVNHPEYDHLIWDLKPTKKGRLPVAKDRGGPFNIAYEMHGHGPRHLVWIMGLGGAKYAWQRQTKDLAHTKADVYSSLILDNRGIGESDKPLRRYSTSEMAKDVIEVLDALGWTGKRQLNLIGISMGGMIAQEMNLINRANLFLPKPLTTQLENIKHNLYTDDWLTRPDDLEYVVQPFPTNGDRFAANEVWKRQHPEWFNKKTFLCQAVAAGWHNKSPAQLQEIAKNVGKRRIMVVHGTKDRMISFPHGVVLWRGLEKGEGRTGREYVGMEVEEDVWVEGEVEKRFIEGQGHVVPIEMRNEFNAWVEALVERGVGLNQREGV